MHGHVLPHGYHWIWEENKLTQIPICLLYLVIIDLWWWLPGLLSLSFNSHASSRPFNSIWLFSLLFNFDHVNQDTFLDSLLHFFYKIQAKLLSFNSESHFWSKELWRASEDEEPLLFLFLLIFRRKDKLPFMSSSGENLTMFRRRNVCVWEFSQEREGNRKIVK